MKGVAKNLRKFLMVLKAIHILRIFISGILFLHINPSYCQTNDLNFIYNKSKNAIFRVEIINADSEIIKIGTGFFISSNGIGVTNYHVFAGATSVRIKTYNGKTYKVSKVLSWSEKSDLVKFQVDHKPNEVFEYLTKEPNQSKIGEKVVVIGSPLGLNFSITDGIISSFRKDDSIGNTIQISVPISSGNSGSPLINLKGNFIGIISFSLKGGQNLNFAISSSELSSLQPINKLIFPSNNESEEKIPSLLVGEDTNEPKAHHLFSCEFAFSEINVLKSTGKAKRITAFFGSGDHGVKVYSSIGTSNKEGWIVSTALAIKSDNLAYACTIAVNSKLMNEGMTYVQFSEISSGRPKLIIDEIYKFKPLETNDNTKLDILKIEIAENTILKIILKRDYYLHAFGLWSKDSNQNQVTFILENY
jgi:hypothetical protein